jgi:hypothetical protein
MVKDIDKIAARLGAKIVCQVPDVGGGAFGMARLAGLIAAIQARLEPACEQGQGGPNGPPRRRCAEVPISEQTQRALERLAELASSPERKVSPMQLAAQLLEDAVEQLTNETTSQPQ